MLRLEKLQLLPARHGLGPAVHVELAIDVLQVLFDRAGGDHQPVANLLVREALFDEATDLELPPGQAAPHELRRLERIILRPLGEPAKQTGRDFL